MILRVIFRDDGPLICLQNEPTYRSVGLVLTPEQEAQLQPKTRYSQSGDDIYEEISQCFIEPE